MHSDMDEVLCDGLSPVLNAANGIPYRCTGGHDCPAGSYCHLQFGKCCNEGVYFFFFWFISVKIVILRTFI